MTYTPYKELWYMWDWKLDRDKTSFCDKHRTFKGIKFNYQELNVLI